MQMICLHTRFRTCTQKELVHRHMHTFIGAKDRARERMKTTSNFMHMQSGTAVERGKLEGAQGTNDCLFSKLQSLIHRHSRIAGMYVSRKRISSTYTGRQTLWLQRSEGHSMMRPLPILPIPSSPAPPPSRSFSPFSTQRNAKGLMSKYKRARRGYNSWIYNKRWSFSPS